MDHQYWENGVRKIYSNYNHMRAYVEALQINPKNYTCNRRYFEDSITVLAVSASSFYQSTAVQLYQPTLMKWVSESVQSNLGHLITTTLLCRHWALVSLVALATRKVVQ